MSRNPERERKFCSEDRECNQHSFKKCPPLPSSFYKHYEWAGKPFSIDHFNCLNRIDKKNEVFKKKLFIVRNEAPSLKYLLKFSKTHFYCNEERNEVSWEKRHLLDFKNEADDLACVLKDDSTLQGSKLLDLLMRDQSFPNRTLYKAQCLNITKKGLIIGFENRIMKRMKHRIFVCK